MSVQPYKHVVVVPQRRRTNGPAGAATAAADTTRILRNGNGIYIRKSRKSLLDHPADESAQMLKIHDQGRTRAPRAGYGATNAELGQVLFCALEQRCVAGMSELNSVGEAKIPVNGGGSVLKHRRCRNQYPARIIPPRIAQKPISTSRARGCKCGR